MKIKKYILIILFIPFFSYAQSVKTKIIDGVAIYFPKEFRKMTEQEITQKYGYTTKIIAAYTNTQQNVQISFSKTDNTWGSDKQLAQSFYKSTISSLYDEVTFLKEDLFTTKEKTYIVFEFISSISGTKNSITSEPDLYFYNYIQYIIVKEKILIVNFSSRKSQMDQWKEKIKQIVNSIDIQKKI